VQKLDLKLEEKMLSKLLGRLEQKLEKNLVSRFAFEIKEGGPLIPYQITFVKLGWESNRFEIRRGIWNPVWS